MSEKREKVARFGIISKGIVYSIVGILTAMSAFNLGGGQSGSRDALSFLAEQSYGKVLLFIMGLGLLSYAFFRFYQVGNASEEDSKKSAIKKVGYAISGIIYLGLSVYSFTLLSGNSSGNSSDFLNFIHNETTKTMVLFLIALGLLAKGIYELYRAYSKKYKEDIGATLGTNAEGVFLKWARFGITSRALVFIIMGFLTGRGALKNDSSLGSKTDAFSFIKQEFGATVLGLIAIGLVGYGVFLFIKSKYAKVALK
ncbi:DUF1206 domain-containing protein [Winogradskyella maritima]|uniref:DUF1206 domain-containing protein n=1 Tax=Winogradskyella maritima TaxID=1517766 RepID=A0ABV8AKL3_9FLAO|nr:DUF1206 domain-containing protein [Winogradskyella maritima]